MPTILTLNKIAAIGLREFPQSYTITEDAASTPNPDAILVRSASLHEHEFTSPTLAVARAGAGVNNIPVEACTEQGVVVFNTPGANANAVKELVVAALFLSSRRVAAALDWCKTLKGQGDAVGKLVEKGKSDFAGPEVFGKTLGVVGLGAIGRLVANAAAALGMQVLGYDPFLTEAQRSQLAPAVKIVEDITALSHQSDYLSLHLPLTAQTRGFVNTDFLQGTKPSVRLLNFSRAELVSEADLLAALASAHVAAYVTDFPTDAIIGHPAVTAIPHLGASTPESEDNCAIMAAQQLTDFLARGEVRNSVNFPATSALPKEFAKRITLVHHGDPQELQASLGTPFFFADFVRGSLHYAVADVPASYNETALRALPGVVRIRVLNS